MPLLERLAQPYYLLRPSHLVRRVAMLGRAEPKAIVRLPWGLDIAVDPGEDIGRLIVTNGLFDLTVSEAIARLLQPGETGVDVGANIGLSLIHISEPTRPY